MTKPCRTPRRDVALARAHLCPVPDCGRVVSDGHVACARHWMSLPRKDRTVLAEAFRYRQQDPELYALAVQRTRTLLGAL